MNRPADSLEAVTRLARWLSLPNHHECDTIRIGVEEARALLAALTPQPPAAVEKRWPFVESPCEFAQRLELALREFDVLGAVRNVLIEEPPTLATPTPAAVPDAVRVKCPALPSIRSYDEADGDAGMRKWIEGYNQAVTEAREAVAMSAAPDTRNFIGADYGTDHGTLLICGCGDETQRRLCVMRDKCCRPAAQQDGQP